LKIKTGDKISELTLPNIDGTEFDLASIKGKKALISFYRYSSCPFCHLRINETINNNTNFGEGFETIAIFNCTLESLQKSSSKHEASISILADEDRKYLKLSLYLIAHLKAFKNHLQNMKHQFLSSQMKIENILTNTVFKKVELGYWLVQLLDFSDS